MDNSSVLSQTITDDIIFITFNADTQCFAVGTEKGYYIYNTNPFRELFHRSKIKQYKQLHIYIHIYIYCVYRFRWRNCPNRNAGPYEYPRFSWWWNDP